MSTTATPIDQSAGPGRQSALSGRISTVLSTSYSDLEIRDALSVLDQRSFKNTAEARRQLRLDIQDEVIKRNGDVLADFGGVVDELRRVDAILARISGTCATLRGHIEEANSLTSPMREEAADLLVRKKGVETQQHILQAFKTHFVMSDDELEALTSVSDPIDGVFFTALAKVKRIHSDSQILLPASSDKLGLSILDQSSKTINTAFQKLFRWTQREFRTLDLENPRLSASMRRGLRVLAERPALFTSSLDNFASTRESTLSNAFHTALTGQGDDTVGKPIEYQAHDPLRYISDMLAWTHSATVGEREALEALFIGEGEELAKGIQKGIDNDPWSRDTQGQSESEAFDGRKALDSLVSRDVAGVSRLLRQRAEQVVQGQEDAIVAFKIANLIAFYKNTFKKLLGEESDVLSTLSHLQSSANRQYRLATTDAVATMQPELSKTPTDASPPIFYKDALSTLRQLLKNHETSVLSSTPSSVDDESTLSIPSILEHSLDPFLAGATTLWTKLPSPRADILALNILLETLSSLSPYTPATAPTISSLETRIKAHANTLTSHIHAHLQRTSGLLQLISELLPIPITSLDGLSKQPSIQHDALRNAATTLDAWLPEALSDAAEGVIGLESVGLAKEVVEEAAELFCAEFEGVEGRIGAVDGYLREQRGKINGDAEGEDSDEEEVSLRDLFPRTSAEIRVLLS